MASTYGGAHAVCPFFIREYSKSVSCEGLSDQAEIIYKFGSAHAKCAHQRRYCFGYDFARCPIAEAILKQYDE